MGRAPVSHHFFPFLLIILSVYLFLSLSGSLHLYSSFFPVIFSLCASFSLVSCFSFYDLTVLFKINFSCLYLCVSIFSCLCSLCFSQNFSSCSLSLSLHFFFLFLFFTRSFLFDDTHSLLLYTVVGLAQYLRHIPT